MSNILDIKDLSIRVRNHNLFRGVSFSVDKGEVVLLSGANGIGKSTLLKSILRLKSDGKTIGGEIIVRGFGNILTLNETELQRFRSSVAYVQQRDDYAEMGNVQLLHADLVCHSVFL